MSDGFIVGMQENATTQQSRMICIVRSGDDESYQHCGCKNCILRRDVDSRQ